MRKRLQEQLPLVPPPIRHERAREYQEVSALLDRMPELLDLADADVRRGRSADTGRPGPTRRDLGVVEVAVRMFDRWRQENFFKYMRQEHAIDALVQHDTEPDDPSRTVPNPARTAMDKEVRKAKREVERLEAEYGAAALDNAESERRTMRGFKIAHGTEIGIPLRQARGRLDQLLDERRKAPKRVPVGDVRVEVVRLPRERKRLSEGLKMLAYQVETDLLRAVAPSYARSLHEGRPLLRAAMQGAADIEVGDGELRVTLAPQSSPHRSRALAALCEILDATDTCFPGTKLRLRYAVAGVPTATKAQG